MEKVKKILSENNLKFTEDYKTIMNTNQVKKVENTNKLNEWNKNGDYIQKFTLIKESSSTVTSSNTPYIK
ncbi:MAG: hypothetical protein K1X86_00865 [Ignavibacteria bacterium]|nr:hypothetical protein [Ignavibacteria bacterium]